MKSVIQINNEKILIGDDVDNTIIEVDRTNFSFEPALGDEVNVFESESKLVVTKKEKLSPASAKLDPEKIYINIVNESSNNIMAQI